MSCGVILLKRPFISFSYPLLLILRWEITAAAVALLCLRLFILLFSVADARMLHVQLFTICSKLESQKNIICSFESVDTNFKHRFSHLENKEFCYILNFFLVFFFFFTNL